MTPYPFIVQGDNITIVIDSQPHTISRTHITYSQVLEAIKAGDWERVKEIVDPVKVVLSFGQGDISIEGDQLFWKERPLHSALATRMVAMLQEGFPIEPMALFMENLYNNPSKRSIDELYGFLEKNALPITPDGHFLAYKRVRENYRDCHSGTMDNSIGNVVEMPRNEVDDERDRTCSTGLHFCSHSYLGHFGGDRIVIVKINPADVVSIPSDYNDAKGRACRYEVIGEVENNPDDSVEFNRSVQSNANSMMFDEDGDSDDFDADLDDDFDVELELERWMEEEEEGPSVGNSLFHRGYTDGYEVSGISPDCVSDAEYLRGYIMGSDDDREYNDPKFEFDSELVVPQVLSDIPKEAWPFPTVAK